MNIDEILQKVQDFRSQLEVWGITSQALWGIGGLSVLLFMLSLREVASWFFRVNKVRDEVYELRVQLAQMQRTLSHISADLGNVPPASHPMRPEELLKIAEGMREPSLGTEKQATLPATKFRFDH